MQFDYSVLFYGITFGIVLMSIVYTFIRYLYSREIFYISYCFMQIFSLIYIIQYSSLWDINNIYKEISFAFASLSAIVFSINFFKIESFKNTTSYKELIINTVLLNIVIVSSFYHFILFEYLPYSIIFGILFLSIIFNLKDSSKSTLFYVFAWLLFCLILFILDFKSYYIKKDFTDIVLVAFAIEAVLFTVLVSYKYKSLKDEKKEYESMLFQQTKLAKSGEMIANITHQFRQPLNNLAYILINMKKKFTNQSIDEEYFNKKMNQANEQIDFLSKTINDFKEFYSLSKKKEVFLVKDSILNVNTIFQAELKKHNIDLEIIYDTDENIKIFGIKNELSQAFLSILSNSKDVLKNIENPKIRITIKANSAEVIIEVFNNGPKIEKTNLNKIFKPYFSTKEEGTGLGLFLCKQIIEDSFEGELLVKNENKGVTFSLIIEKAVI